MTPADRGTHPDDRATGVSLVGDDPRALDRPQTGATGLQASLPAFPQVPPATGRPDTSTGFDAEITPTGAVLTLPDRRRVVLEAVERPAGSPPPFAYDFRPPSAASPTGRLLLVLAPGIQVQVLPASPQVEAELVRQKEPAVLLGTPISVFRVQDSADVPAQGATIRAADFMGLQDPPPEGKMAAPREVEVERRPNGVELFLPTLAASIRISVPPASGHAGYVYRVVPWQESASRRTEIWVAKTRKAEVTLVVPEGLQPRRPNDLSALLSVRLFEVASLAELPTWLESWSEVGQELPVPLVRPVATDVRLWRAGIDIVASLIPGVGDLIDAWEFLLSLPTGIDRWGQEVGPAEQVVMGIGVFMPFVGGATVRGLAELAQILGKQPDELRALIDGLAQLDDDQVRVLQEARDHILVQHAIPAELAPRLETTLRKLAEAVRSTAAGAAGRPRLGMDDILSGRGFVGSVDGLDPRLTSSLDASARDRLDQDLKTIAGQYERYLAEHGNDALPPDQWSVYATRGPYRSILTRLLGEGSAKGIVAGRAGGRRLVTLANFPRPRDYGGLEEDLALLFRPDGRAHPRLLDWLDRLLAAEGLPPGAVDFSHFVNLKGAVAEILSSALQQQVLRRYQALHRDVALFTHVLARLPGKDKWVQFSDNLIGAIRRGHLQLFAVIEVKSGVKGGQLATSQVFKWIEKHLDDGPDGLVLRVDGHEFAYAPGSNTLQQVVGLARAERLLITARGAEHLGLQSADQVAAQISRYALDRTSRELDYLTRALIEHLQRQVAK